MVIPQLRQARLKARGYTFADPRHSLLDVLSTFSSAFHLEYAADYNAADHYPLIYT
jgi:hypothetical protein